MATIKLEQAFLRQIKNSYDLRELVLAEHPDSFKWMGNELVGRCLFHSESTASFRVNKERYHCFGCGIHGDLFAWVMQREDVPFRTAVDLLSKDIPFISEPAEKPPAFTPYDAIKILEEYQAHQEDYARFKDERLNKLPYLPERHSYFHNRVMCNDESIGYDSATNRITIPLWSHNGQNLLGFAKRKIPEASNETLPKYTNPKNACFARKRYLFNLNYVPTGASEVLVVEGLFDVLSMRWAGFQNVAATLGTSVTNQQLELLDSFRTVTFLFDGDLPGLNAIARLAPTCLSLKAHYQAILLSGKIDPDSLCRQKSYDYQAIVAYLKQLPKVRFTRFLSNKLDLSMKLGEWDRSLLDEMAKPYVEANIKEGWPQYNVVDWVVQAYPAYGPAIRAAILAMRDDHKIFDDGTKGFKEQRIKDFLREWIKPCRDVRRAHKEASGK